MEFLSAEVHLSFDCRLCCHLPSLVVILQAAASTYGTRVLSAAAVSGIKTGP